MESCRFTAPLWRWQAQDSWFFVTLPEDAAETIRERPRPARGFGSVRVRVHLDGPGPVTVWETSVFPDSRSGSYVLPVKKKVRAAHDLEEGDPLDLMLEVLD
ncbi:DUF1905 domain-containing protein [Intrasporangium calvum]|uniref:DUF1905 domain-containing protein n=1 Tax=Intrasporangium calvum TaxID=53358 RepID=A0ABT5GF53_9MICO|nr:DUF1905 domain-containing protein [Intrasporangium calvum]MDC5696768.1 DUF1905 domain-containing protein [Intrasporangium calvum]